MDLSPVKARWGNERSFSAVLVAMTLAISLSGCGDAAPGTPASQTVSSSATSTPSPAASSIPSEPSPASAVSAGADLSAGLCANADGARVAKQLAPLSNGSLTGSLAGSARDLETSDGTAKNVASCTLASEAGYELPGCGFTDQHGIMMSLYDFTTGPYQQTDEIGDFSGRRPADVVARQKALQDVNNRPVPAPVSPGGVLNDGADVWVALNSRFLLLVLFNTGTARTSVCNELVPVAAGIASRARTWVTTLP